MLSHIKTPYFLTCDDNFEFTNETKVEKMYQAARDSELDIIAGNVNGMTMGVPRNAAKKAQDCKWT